MALALGALAVINTWDLPTYFGLAMLVWLVREFRSGQMAASWPRALLRTVIFAIGLAAAAILLYLPFFAHYEALASSGIGINKLADDLGKWLNMWGFLGFLAASFVLVELRRRGQAETQEDGPSSASPRDPAFLRWLRVALNRVTDLARWVELTPRLSTRALAAIGLAVGLAALLWLTGWQVPAVLLLPLLGAFVLLWRRRASSESLFVSVLLFTAFLVLMGVEFVYLKDHLQGGEWRRMNTLFKFYIQVWVMLALGAAVSVAGNLELRSGPLEAGLAGVVDGNVCLSVGVVSGFSARRHTGRGWTIASHPKTAGPQWARSTAWPTCQPARTPGILTQPWRQVPGSS